LNESANENNIFRITFQVDALLKKTNILIIICYLLLLACNLNLNYFFKGEFPHCIILVYSIQGP